jgi:hypothetical protein
VALLRAAAQHLGVLAELGVRVVPPVSKRCALSFVCARAAIAVLLFS